jgi:diguanylate cyclase (GGDEF)-like protein
VLIWASLGAAAACALAYAGYIAGGEPGALSDVAGRWVYHATLAFASLTFFLRAALVPDRRGAWIAFGLGLALWAAGDLYWTLAYTGVQNVPYPSPADAGYLAALPCFYVGIALLIKGRIGHFTIASWLDGAIGGLAAASMGTAVLAPALVGLTMGDPAAVLTNLAYPLGDILLIGFIIGALVISGARGAREFLAIGAGLIVWTLADGIYLYQEATSGYSEGWLDQLWLLGGVLMAAAAAASLTQPALRRRAYSPSIAFPSMFAAVAVGVLAWDHFSRLHEVSVWLSVATLVAAIFRMGLSFRENVGLMAALHDDAVTDSLTKLGNRRKLMTDLESALGPGAAARDGYVFALYDLDGFKFYNDSFGHPAGDSLLRRLGANLAAAVEPDGRGYRLGGDEFCILAELRGRRMGPVVEAGRAALTEEGEGFRISASAGAVALSAEALVPSEALRIADRRMYDEKGVRTGRLETRTHDLLVSLLRDRQPEPADHQEDVSRIAVAMGRELGMDPEEIDVLRRAAELHDLGKIAIPDEILRKSGPLDEIEGELMRKHTLVGERILGTAPALAPVARLVRSSHERWDGQGYPDGLAGEDIPLGARVIFLCDAFDAMRKERSHSPAREQQEALAEIRRAAGIQFDPQLVDLFCTVVARDERDEGPAARGAEIAARPVT